jgi:WD40 repeat protein
MHAEATLTALGDEKLPIVRELFRNLVTAEGTRAVREWNELLSVFCDSSDESQAVLRSLIDARLLTSYEVREDDREPTRRVEIIHESLLANWPRLVRWRTQDADAAQLRDQLRQAAKTWDDQGRTDDTLWTGAAYREFVSWRDRYSGGLSEVEEAFASAMTSLAMKRRRRRRIASVAAAVVFAFIAAVFAALWRRGVMETRRAEAQKLIALGHVELEDYPTAALAHATRSLELANSDEARLLAMRALWSGPTAFVVDETPTNHVSFSLDGKWLVQSRDLSSSLGVISRDGQIRVVAQPGQSTTLRIETEFGELDDVFLSQGSRDGGNTARFGIWSASEGRLLASAPPIEGWDSEGWPVIDADSTRPRALFAKGRQDLVIFETLYVDGAHQRLGELRLRAPPGDHADYCLDPASGDWLALVEYNVVSVVRVGEREISNRQPLGRHEGDRIWCVPDSQGRYFLTVSRSGVITRWDPSGAREPITGRLPAGPVSSRPRLSLDGALLFALIRRDDRAPEWSIVSVADSGFKLVRSLTGVGLEIVGFDTVTRRVVMTGFSGPLPAPRLWSLDWPEGAQPLRLRRGPANRAMSPKFSPDGRWIAISERNGLSLWPLSRSYPVVLGIDSIRSWSNGVSFAPDGRSIAAAAGREIRVWPLNGPIPAPAFVGLRSEGDLDLRDPAFSPDGERMAACTDGKAPANEVWIRGVGEYARPLSCDEHLNNGTGYVTFSSDGRLVAAADGTWDKNDGAYHVWEAATRVEVADLRLDGEELRYGLSFARDGRLLTGSTRGVSAWNVETGERELLVSASVLRFVANADGRRLLLTEEGSEGIFQDPAGSPSIFDLDAGNVTVLTTHGGRVRSLALDEAGDVAVTGGSDGVIRVGPVTGDEPHLLLGHEEEVLSLAIDPTGRWIASCSMDKTVRLWPMPDLSKPPLHTLPREELIAKLKTLTNLRVVRDPESSTGWKLTHDPFPGWETVPEW